MAKKNPSHEELKPGTKVLANGYEGHIRRQYDGDLYEVIMDRGECCLDKSDIILVEKFDGLSGDELQAALVTAAKLGELRDCGWAPWLGIAPSSTELGDITSTPEDGVGIRVAECDESFLCGFDCCGVATYEWLELPEDLASRLSR